MALEDWLLLPTALSALAWPAVALGVHTSYRRCRALRPATEIDSDAPPPRVSVIVTACGEADDLDATVRSLLAQRGVELDDAATSRGSRSMLLTKRHAPSSTAPPTTTV